MASDEQKKIFAANLLNLLNSNEMTQKELAGVLGVSQQRVSTWTNAISIPHMDIVQAIADYFGTTKSSLLDPLDQSKIVLNDQERSLVLAYRKCSPERKTIILELVGISSNGGTN